MTTTAIGFALQATLDFFLPAKGADSTFIHLIARTDREIPHFSFLFAFSLLILLRLAEGQLDRSCFAFGFGGRGKGERIKKS